MHLQMKESLFSFKVEKRSATLSGLSEKLDGVNTLIKSVVKAMSELPGIEQKGAEKLPHILKLEAVQEQVLYCRMHDFFTLYSRAWMRVFIMLASSLSLAFYIKFSHRTVVLNA
jgi:hypothetical protein